MGYTNNQSRQALRGFPKRVEIVLEGVNYDGRTQLIATFDHGGRNYKLVISEQGMDSRRPGAGERWIVSLDYTPNDHIILCFPIEKVADAPVFDPSEDLGLLVEEALTEAILASKRH